MNPPVTEEPTDTQHGVATAKLEAYIEKVVSEAPPFDPVTRDRLALLLRGGA